MVSDFLNSPPVAQQVRERSDKCMKLKSFCIAKETVTRQKTQPTGNRRKSFPAIPLTRIHNQLVQGDQKTNPTKDQHPID
jgi:hypothetical protein